MVINTDRNNLPLCPNIGEPIHPLHKLHNQIQDEAYNSQTKTEELEFQTPELNKMYNAISHKRYNGRMSLYMDSVTLDKRRTSITAWYFRCNICGLILPATEQQWR